MAVWWSIGALALGVSRETSLDLTTPCSLHFSSCAPSLLAFVLVIVSTSYARYDFCSIAPYSSIRNTWGNPRISSRNAFQIQAAQRRVNGNEMRKNTRVGCPWRFYPLASRPLLLILVFVFFLVGAATGERSHLPLAPCRYKTTDSPIPNMRHPRHALFRVGMISFGMKCMPVVLTSDKEYGRHQPGLRLPCESSSEWMDIFHRPSSTRLLPFIQHETPCCVSGWSWHRFWCCGSPS